MVSSNIVREKFPQFSCISLINDIADSGKEYSFKAGEIVIDMGMPIPFIPLITKGALRIVRRDEDDHEILLYYLDSGQTCATSLTCCMANVASEVEAIAEEDVELIGIPARLADKWFEKYPEWKNFVMNTYKYRFDELLETINSIAFTQLDKRLIKYLKNKSKLHGKKTLNTSHQEIATDLNSSREVISRLLKQLEKAGKLNLSRNAIELVDI
jgi:CRP/FNR family transcriptional regulator